jgi:hypothetical protein
LLGGNATHRWAKKLERASRLEKKNPCSFSKPMMQKLREKEQVEKLTLPNEMQAFALRRMF